MTKIELTFHVYIQVSGMLQIQLTLASRSNLRFFAFAGSTTQYGMDQPAPQPQQPQPAQQPMQQPVSKQHPSQLHPFADPRCYDAQGKAS